MITRRKSIDPSTHIGIVSLNVKHLKELRHFYTEVLMLEVLQESESEIILGKGKSEILQLIKREDLDFPLSNSTGLYHLAILFSSRGELAKHLQNLFEKASNLYEGSGDHTVSEAFYFSDPEDNGIELYFDRPRDEWTFDDSGKIIMGSEYIDEIKYIEKYLDQKESSVIKMGHIHLKIGDIRDALKFYVDILGFDIMAQMPTALFLSAGGYHHHIGFNTWNSFGTSKKEEALGLNSFEIVVPDLNDIKVRLKENSVDYAKEGSTIMIADPWNNLIQIKSEQLLI